MQREPMRDSTKLSAANNIGKNKNRKSSQTRFSVATQGSAMNERGKIITPLNQLHIVYDKLALTPRIGGSLDGAKGFDKVAANDQ